jgi:hypothetical protein
MSDERMLPQTCQDAIEAELWRRHAKELRQLLDGQNKVLYKIAHDSGVLMHLLGKWAEWRKSQCDFDETVSDIERELIKRTTR